MIKWIDVNEVSLSSEGKTTQNVKADESLDDLVIAINAAKRFDFADMKASAEVCTFYLRVTKDKTGLLQIGEPFDQYITALRLNLQYDIDKCEPLVLDNFDGFVKTRLKKLATEVPDAGSILLTLFDKFMDTQKARFPHQLNTGGVLPNRFMSNPRLDVAQDGFQILPPKVDLGGGMTVQSEYAIPPRTPRAFYFEVTLGPDIVTTKYLVNIRSELIQGTTGPPIRVSTGV
jgi:hypothetical protein